MLHHRTSIYLITSVYPVFILGGRKSKLYSNKTTSSVLSSTPTIYAKNAPVILPPPFWPASPSFAVNRSCGFLSPASLTIGGEAEMRCALSRREGTGA